MIDISVVIPYYNESETISQTLYLIANQTYKPKEVIFVNSSSSDTTSEIIDSWVKNQKHLNQNTLLNINSNSKTPSSSKNIGIKTSHYPWIAFMDCGLVFSKKWLEELVIELKRNNFEPKIISGVCKLHGDNIFDVCAVAQTYGVGTKRVCIPGSLVNKSVFDSTGLFLENMRASYDRAWQMRTHRRSIARVNPKDNNVSYIGVNFSSSLTNLFGKVFLYSKPAVKVKKYYTPIIYILSAGMLLGVFIASLGYGFLVVIFYAFFRGYFVPLSKSKSKIILISNLKSILLLPIIGMVIDISRLSGYFLGYREKLFSKK